MRYLIYLLIRYNEFDCHETFAQEETVAQECILVNCIKCFKKHMFWIFVRIASTKHMYYQEKRIKQGLFTNHPSHKGFFVRTNSFEW